MGKLNMSFILMGYNFELIGALYLSKSIITRGAKEIAEETTLKYAYVKLFTDSLFAIYFYNRQEGVDYVRCMYIKRNFQKT